MAKILVVDDEAKIRMIIKEYAEFEGYEVEQAADGMEAVEKAKGGDFDIIIMDRRKDDDAGRRSGLIFEADRI